MESRKSLFSFYDHANISDVDECETREHGCEQTCNNLPGSYNCSCVTGFMLNNDNRTCSGTYYLCVQTRVFRSPCVTL